MEIKVHSNENIELDLDLFEWIKIQLKKIGCKLMKKYSKYVDEYCVWEKKIEYTNPKKTFFHAFLFRNGLNKL